MRVYAKPQKMKLTNYSKKDLFKNCLRKRLGKNITILNRSSHSFSNNLTREPGVCAYALNMKILDDSRTEVGEGLSDHLLQKIIQKGFEIRQSDLIRCLLTLKPLN